MSTPWQPGCSLETLQRRAELLSLLRTFFAERQVLEVQTAVLAEHTVTDLHIESMAVGPHGYLQTSPEYQLKRLLAAGVPSLYQIGPVFRAGEVGRLHNPEFTLIEWYRLGFDDHRLMQEVADLVDAVLGPAPYRTMAYADLVTDIEAPREQLDLEVALRIEALASSQPHERVFITDYPADQAALARVRENDPRVAGRFELTVQGIELANGYWELGDAAELRARFERDNARRAARGLPTMPLDERFLDAMAAGLPDCAGVALGVDRLVMLALHAEGLAEVMPFAER
mgnify:CR=1 FL=1